MPENRESKCDSVHESKNETSDSSDLIFFSCQWSIARLLTQFFRARPNFWYRWSVVPRGGARWYHWVTAGIETTGSMPTGHAIREPVILIGFIIHARYLYMYENTCSDIVQFNLPYICYCSYLIIMFNFFANLTNIPTCLNVTSDTL